MTHRLLLAWTFMLSMATIASGQLAPDFDITDSDGVNHQLYEDFLDQDKTVLIKIFFTTCPPCRSIAASTEIFYQQWGAGDHDVEFFELSNKSFDDDTRVNNYKAEFGITFPSVGADGGSLDALAPYLAGDFGPFFGTPTFVVIAPDGTVQWDVDGSDLWDALDEALYATGATKPGDVDPPDSTDTPDPEPVILEGRVHSYQDALKGLSEAEVFVTSPGGVEVARDTTDFEGNYVLVIDSAVVADSVLTVHVEKDDDPKNGITATDLLLIQKHLLGLTPLDLTEKLLASDANINTAISATDLLFLKKLLLNLEDAFPDGKTWLFYHTDLDLGSPGGQPPVVDPGPILVSEILAGNILADFRAIKRGDVNDSADY